MNIGESSGFRGAQAVRLFCILPEVVEVLLPAGWRTPLTLQQIPDIMRQKYRFPPDLRVESGD